MEENLNQPLPTQNAGISLDKTNANTWAMLCHVSTFSGSIIPFGNIVGPFLVWQLKKETSPLVDEHGKEALNFQITMLIYSAISFALMLVSIGFLTFALLVLADIILTIIAAVKASKGEHYRYPVTFRFIK